MTPIYLDYNATTPIDPRVVSAMQPYFAEHFGNPASANHIWGWAADHAVQKSRQHIAELLGCNSADVYFTSGSTESNNWALRGIIENFILNNPQQRIHIITSNAEHNSISKPLQYLQKIFPIEVDFVPVNAAGVVELEAVKKYIRPETKLMSFIWVNNEIGSINPIQELSQLAHDNSVIFHTDATQAIGKIPINLAETNIDLLSLSSHKMYGPKGVGALIMRNKEARPQPLICGGGQEKGLRSGTLNVAGIVGFAEACRITKIELTEEILKSLEMQKYFWGKLEKMFPGVRLNGARFSLGEQALKAPLRSPTNISVTFAKSFPPGGLQDPKLGVSAGSACSTASMTTSHVLKALNLNTEDVQRTLRFSFGRFTQIKDIDLAIERLSQAFEIPQVNSNKLNDIR